MLLEDQRIVAMIGHLNSEGKDAAMVANERGHKEVSKLIADAQQNAKDGDDALMMPCL